MKINRHVPKDAPHSRSYTMVTMTPKEALMFIESLSRQVRTSDPNTNRPEILVREGEFQGYFSIAVMEE